MLGIAFLYKWGRVPSLKCPTYAVFVLGEVCGIECVGGKFGLPGGGFEGKLHLPVWGCGM